VLFTGLIRSIPAGRAVDGDQSLPSAPPRQARRARVLDSKTVAIAACQTSSCKDDVRTYGQRYDAVRPITMPPSFFPAATVLCSRCGGYSNGRQWKHVCSSCNATVKAGDLQGLPVPTRCARCDAAVVAAERKHGAVCPRCRAVKSYCCCTQEDV